MICTIQRVLTYVVEDKFILISTLIGILLNIKAPENDINTDYQMCNEDNCYRM